MTTSAPIPATFFGSFEATTSELEVINVLISSLGEAPVTQFNPSPSSDVDLALIALNEADKQVQNKGWEWNRTYQLPLALDQSGFVQLPENTLRVVQAYSTSGNLGFNSQNGMGLLVTQRGERLYDQVNHTFVFTQAPAVDLIMRLQWCDIPDIFRNWIGFSALQKFQSRIQQSSIVLQANPRDIQDAMTTCEQWQDEQSRQSAIKGNTNVISSLYGIGGMRRNRGGY